MPLDVQVQTDLTNHPYIVDGVPFVKRVTIKQDAGRSGAMVKGTIMAYDTTNKKYVPLTDVAATDGTQFPKAILLEDQTEAAIKAGDITNVPMIVGGRGLVMNEDLLTWENSLTKDSIITVPTNLKIAAWEWLLQIGIVFVDTQEGTSYEA